MIKEELNIGIIGAGGFAAFASKTFLKIPGIKIIAVTDINESVAVVGVSPTTIISNT